MDAVLYSNTNDVKVPFRMSEFSSRKIITHRFHLDNAEGDTGIGYNTTIDRELTQP